VASGDRGVVDDVSTKNPKYILGNLIGNTYYFHEDDIIIVISVVQSVIAIFAPAVFFHNSLVKHIESNKKKCTSSTNKCNEFKCQ